MQITKRTTKAKRAAVCSNNHATARRPRRLAWS